jgi:hypothetical protein
VTTFAEFCATIGNVVEYKNSYARINLGTDTQPHFMVLAYRLPSRPLLWRCSSCSYPHVEATSEHGYEEAYRAFKRLYLERIPIVLDMIEHRLGNIPDRSLNDFQILTKIGSVVEYTDTRFLVDVSFPPETLKFEGTQLRAGTSEYFLSNLSVTYSGKGLLSSYVNLLTGFKQRLHAVTRILEESGG